jgi:hypothetical protein
MSDLSLAERLGVGGFFLSLFSIWMSLFFESRRTKGKIEVTIKSIEKRSTKESCVVVYHVEIVNASLEKRYIKSIYQHNTLGRFSLFFLKNEKGKNHIKSWQIREEFLKHISLERGESAIKKYEFLFRPESANRRTYVKFLVCDFFGKQYKSPGIYVIPDQLEEAPFKPGLIYL